jgi:hypothetical protein
VKRKIYDAPLTFLFLLLFVSAVLLPFGLALARGRAPFKPVLEMPFGKGPCVDDAETMRTAHMTMLHAWQNDAIRSGNRAYVAASGVSYEKSLSKTCMGCHTDEKTFCAACHDAVGASNNCFSCHIAEDKELQP